MKIKYEIPHVTLLFNDKGETRLRIEDTELFDTIDDILIEQYNFENYTHSSENINGIEVFTIYFPDNIDCEKLEKVLKGLNKEEIEKIFNLNNII